MVQSRKAKRTRKSLSSPSPLTDPELECKVKHQGPCIMSDSWRLPGLYSPWDSPGQNTGVASLFLLRGIFPTQGLNLGLLHCRRILYQLSYQGKSRFIIFSVFGSHNPHEYLSILKKKKSNSFLVKTKISRPKLGLSVLCFTSAPFRTA